MGWDIALIAAIIGIPATIIAITNNLFNLRDRLNDLRLTIQMKKFKSDYKEGNPAFEFKMSYISNSPPGSCKISISIINRSKEVKYINMISYKFSDQDKDIQVTVPVMIMKLGQFPKRLEHGEPYHYQVEFKDEINNTIYQCWKKGVKVYATCESTTGDLLRSNAIEYDKLAERLVPINKPYQKIAKKLFTKFGGSQRDIEASLWQLQLFGRITSHVTNQLESNNIPVLQFLSKEYGVVLKGTNWYNLYKELEEKKIPPSVLIDYLNSIV